MVEVSADRRPLKVAVFVKQVPSFESLTLGPDGRLVRDGLAHEMNPYCRRAVSKGVEVAQESGGTCTVFSLGPPQAEDSLREAVAWGADAGVLITDRAFAGSDTLATSRALAAALGVVGNRPRWDLILVGRNSVDADTGQVGPGLAELLGLPFLPGVKRLDIAGERVRARLEQDDGWAEAEVDLPAVLSCAERLCEPAKVDVGDRAKVPDQKIRRLGAIDLGPGPWGQAGSPTTVGEVRVLAIRRERRRLAPPTAHQVSALARELSGFQVLDSVPSSEHVVTRSDGTNRTRSGGDGSIVAVVVERDRERVTRELLGAAARLAAEIRGTVAAIAPVDELERSAAGTWGADHLVEIAGSAMPDDVAHAVAAWCKLQAPWAVLTAATNWGREVASRIAVRIGAGLTGDAVGLSVDGGRLLGWKPAFGGQMVAAICATSPVQMATVRPGVLPLPTPRSRVPVTCSSILAPASRRVKMLDVFRDDDLDLLASASAVVGVGGGVLPQEYPLLSPLLGVLGAELGATRKVTDQGWLPRSRQIGITGRSLSPALYLAIGIAGKFNHLLGVRGAGRIIAINQDPGAPIFESADVGVLADWHDIVPPLVEALTETASREIHSPSRSH